MPTEFIAIAAIVAAVACLIFHIRFDLAIRRLYPASKVSAEACKAAVSQYRKLDRYRMGTACGVIASFAICGILWSVPGLSALWSGSTEILVKLTASAIFLSTFVIVERHNYHRDCR